MDYPSLFVVDLKAMDCSSISPLAIDAMNFALSLLPWFPAVYVFIQIASDIDAISTKKYPGYDNSNIRAAVAVVAMPIATLIFCTVWWAGLLLTKGFRCTF